MPFITRKKYITTTSVPMTLANKYGFAIPRMEYYGFPHTWIHHTTVVNKYTPVSILRYFSI